MGSFYLLALLRLWLLLPAAELGDETLAALKERYAAAQHNAIERARTAQEIASLGTDDALEFLSEQFFTERERAVRRALLDGLLRGGNALQRLGKAQRVLREASLASDPYLRARSIGAYIVLAPREALQRAKDILLYDEDGRVRQAAIQVLGKDLDLDGAAFLIEACAVRPFEEQRVAVLLLSAWPRLEELLGAEAPFWREASQSPAQHLLATLVLASRASPSSKSLLQRLSREEDRRIAATAAIGVDRIRGQGTGSAVKRILAGTRDSEDRCEVLDVIGRIGLRDPGLTEVLAAELRHRDWRLRAIAAEALGGAAGEGGIAPLAELLGREKVWQVRIAAIRALGSCTQGAAVEPLIDALELARGREASEAARALGRLTGMSLGRNAATWRQWWQDHRDSFSFPPPEVALWVEAASPSDRYAFYGIEVDSEQVAFALDTSGSMQGSPLDVLKGELTPLVKGLPAGTLFNMVFFDSTVKPWREGLVALNDATRTEALHTVRYLEAGGGTDLWGGIGACLTDERVDSIYLLSDGQPTAGKIQNVEAICEELTVMNRHRRVTFHVVLIGYSSESFRKLAQDSGGTYVEVGR
ncbi:MAG: HEAT repeat domain-containing protein [Planctomycetota bacterium]